MTYTVKNATGTTLEFEADDIGAGVLRPKATVITDQTTPGLTDLNTARYARPCYPIRQSVTLAGSYASGETVGGLIQVICKDSSNVALPAGTFVFVANVALLTPGSGSFGNSQYLLFDANPTASTLTDSAAAVVDAADYAKVVGYYQDGPLTLNSGATGPVLSRATTSTYVKLDTGGKFYVARVYASGTISGSSALFAADVRY